MDTYNIYMDEAPAAQDANGDEGWEVEFRVVAQSIDDRECVTVSYPGFWTDLTRSQSS